MQTKHRIPGVLLGVWLCAACPPTVPRSQPAVRPGLEVLLTDSLHLVRGKRVGLVTNQSGVDADGVPGVERLLAAGVKLVALFSPEHGFRGTADPGAAVASATDSATGLPIYSLYGRNTAPTDSMLAGIDVILVDLQDAGARYFTYIWTTDNTMRAAGERGIPIVVLDRPNPLGGLVQGNVLDTAYRTPVGLLAVPMRHGMTMGELARLVQAERELRVPLTVVPVRGWRREMYFDETGLPFIPPSPNLRSLEALIHYPGLCLFEGTALSVGRGSDAPFEQVGAPWLDTAAVLAAMAGENLPGVAFRSVQFTPRVPGDGKYGDTLLAGIRLQVTDRSVYDPTRAAVALLAAVQRLHPERIGWIPRHFDRLAGGSDLRNRLLRGESAESITAGWRTERRNFETRRRGVLLY